MDQTAAFRGDRSCCQPPPPPSSARTARLYLPTMYGVEHGEAGAESTVRSSESRARWTASSARPHRSVAFRLEVPAGITLWSLHLFLRFVVLDEASQALWYMSHGTHEHRDHRQS